jgi:hypothetical protein
MGSRCSDRARSFAGIPSVVVSGLATVPARTQYASRRDKIGEAGGVWTTGWQSNHPTPLKGAITVNRVSGGSDFGAARASGAQIASRARLKWGRMQPAHFMSQIRTPWSNRGRHRTVKPVLTCVALAATLALAAPVWAQSGPSPAPAPAPSASPSPAPSASPSPAPPASPSPAPPLPLPAPVQPVPGTGPAVGGPMMR